MSLFDPVVAQERFGRQFREVYRGKGFGPARVVMDQVFERMGDPDGNFREQVQTTGFDARLWELYLFAAFEEQGWSIDRNHAAPDFLLEDDRFSWAVEATTAAGEPRSISDPDQLLEFLSQELPIRLGSPLYTKLQRRYHDAAHVAGKPLVLALECFISDQGTFFSENTITDYLFGYRALSARRDDGTLDIRFERIREHRLGEKVIPSGFFEQENARDIAAVLFSNSATISKFNRIGFRRQVPNDVHTMMRFGLGAVHDPNQDEPGYFSYDVADRDEAWSEGLVLIHNPNARNPLPINLLPGLAHYRLEEGKIVSELPAFHPFTSRTLIVITKP